MHFHEVSSVLWFSLRFSGAQKGKHQLGCA